MSTKTEAETITIVRAAKSLETVALTLCNNDPALMLTSYALVTAMTALRARKPGVHHSFCEEQAVRSLRTAFTMVEEFLMLQDEPIAEA